MNPTTTQIHPSTLCEQSLRALMRADVVVLRERAARINAGVIDRAARKSQSRKSSTRTPPPGKAKPRRKNHA
jgi:hypothetical protein